MKRCKHEEEIILLAYDELAETEKNRALAHIEYCNHCKNAFSEYKLCAKAFQSLPEVPVFHSDPSRLREAILSRELRKAARWNLARAFAFSASIVAAISLALFLPSYLSRTSSNEYSANLSGDAYKRPDERIANSGYSRSPATTRVPLKRKNLRDLCAVNHR